MTAMDWLWILLAAPVITAILAWRLNIKYGAWLQLGGAGVMLVAGWMVVWQVMTGSPVMDAEQIIYVDALGAWNLGLVVFVGFTASLYSVGYMGREQEEGAISERQLNQYYLLFHLFLFSMIGASVVNSVGLMWAAIELTTVVSVLLVGMYNKETALEAAWKYLIMGSVGLSFALLGIIFVYLSGFHVLEGNPLALHWTVLHAYARELHPQWVLTGFMFVLIGFGAKAGLAPMHFWLPDAHSQAPSPVSAVLSGVLLNTALYAILRVFVIANITLQGEISRYLIFFGLFSVAVTVPFILVQKDLKRMLAYSSVEHIGIVALGVGIGGPLGIYGAILHMLNHSLAKPMLFMAAGNINQKYHTRQMERITGVLSTMPVTGKVFLIGIFAITGAPPFNIFISEFSIMMAGFKTGQSGIAVLFLSFVVLIFAGMMHYGIKMVYGQAPPAMESGELSRTAVLALFLPLLGVVLFGLYIPPFLHDMILKVALVLQGAN